MFNKLASLSVVCLLVAASSGCGATALFGLFGGAPPAQANLSGDEEEILYSRGLRRALPDEIKKLKIKPDERVWVVNKVGGSNGDGSVDGLTYDAIVDVLRNSAISEVVERDDDLLRGLYVEYTESGTLEARDKALAEQGKLKNADVVLAYRVTRLNVRNPGFIVLGWRFFLSGIVGLFADAQVNTSDGLRIAIHLDVIDTRSGTVRTTALVEHVEPQPTSFVADTVYEEIPY